MKIIGFLQIRNEEASGHLARFIDRNLALFDKLYVFDDASTDATRELIAPYATEILGGRDSKFSSELENKSELLTRIQLDCDANDAILWLDADEVIYASKEELKQLIEESFALGFDSIALKHRNLWRSYRWFRVDDRYNDLNPARIWRLSEQLSFPSAFGLHVRTEPLGLSATRSIEKFPVVHFGFASTELILRKHESYRQHWLSGYALNRLVSENGLRLEPLPASPEIMGERFLDLHEDLSSQHQPEPIAPLEWEFLSSQLQLEFEQKSQKPEVTLVCLIYKDLEWLEFQYSQLLQLQMDLPIGKAKILFIANDATPEVQAFLRENLIPHKVVSTKAHEGEWFINSVYRGYNMGVEFAESEYVFLVNSDMAYMRGTLARAYARRDPKLFLASRLVEQGFMESGQYGIERNFGSSPKTFRAREFAKFANSISERTSKGGGLFMPLLVHRETFLDLGGFPEGNVSTKSIQKYISGGEPEIAPRGAPSVPGDRALVMRASHCSVNHMTVFDSVAYHFQAGERRSKRKHSKVRTGFAIVNSLMTGINQETVLWGTLVERLSKKGSRVFAISTGQPVGRLGSLLSPIALWIKTATTFRKYGQPRVSFSNASYSLTTPGSSRRVVYRQDSPADTLNQIMQKNNISRADSVLANDPIFVEAHNQKDVRWVPVPLSEAWWEIEPKLPTDSISKSVIFVGSFSKTKGWPALADLVRQRSDINWTLVSKYAEDQHGLEGGSIKNWEVFRQLPQLELKRLVANSDLLIVASPYETQCLAALEALSQNTPVLTTPTGFLGGFSVGRHDFGIVSEDLPKDLDAILQNLDSFQPRRFLESLNLLGDNSWENWDKILGSQMEMSFRNMSKASGLSLFIDRAIAFGWSQIRLTYRRVLKPTLMLTYRRVIKLRGFFGRDSQP